MIVTSPTGNAHTVDPSRLDQIYYVKIKGSDNNKTKNWCAFWQWEHDKLVTDFSFFCITSGFLFLKVVYRTHTVSALLRDLFIPTFYYIGIQKIKSLALRIFTSGFFLFLDMVTFPLRMISLRQRLRLKNVDKNHEWYPIYAKNEEHPLYQSLLRKGCNKEFLDKNDSYTLKRRKISVGFRWDNNGKKTLHVTLGPSTIDTTCVHSKPYCGHRTSEDESVKCSKQQKYFERLKQCYLQAFPELSEDDYQKDFEAKIERLNNPSIPTEKINHKGSKNILCIVFLRKLSKYIPAVVGTQYETIKDQELFNFCKGCYRRFAREFHPDRYKVDKGEAFKTINALWTELNVAFAPE